MEEILKLTNDVFMRTADLQGWDAAVDLAEHYAMSISPCDKRDAILQNVAMYNGAYATYDYNNTLDPDYGDCYMIRKRALYNIYDLLPAGSARWSNFDDYE